MPHQGVRRKRKGETVCGVQRKVKNTSQVHVVPMTSYTSTYVTQIVESCHERHLPAKCFASTIPKIPDPVVCNPTTIVVEHADCSVVSVNEQHQNTRVRRRSVRKASRIASSKIGSLLLSRVSVPTIKPSTSGHSPSALTAPESDPYSSSMKFNEMNDDCIIHLLSFLSIRDLIKFERITTRFHKLSGKVWIKMRHVSFWSSLEPVWKKYNDGTWEPWFAIQAVMQRCSPYLEGISFKDIPTFRISPFTLTQLALSCPNLKSLNLHGRSMNDFTLEKLEEFKQLEHLVLSKCFDGLTYEQRQRVHMALKRVMKNLPKLDRLSIDNFKFDSYLYDKNDGQWLYKMKLKSLSLINTIGPTGSWEVFEQLNLNHITEFRVSEVTFASHGDIPQYMERLRSLLTAWQNHLTVLELRDFTSTHEIAAEPMMKVVPSIMNLKELSLRGNRCLTPAILRQICTQLTRLEHLDIQCTSMRSEGLASLGSAAGLRYLNVARCKQLTDDHVGKIVQNHNLVSFLANGCVKITTQSCEDLAVNCPMLNYVDLTGNGNITGESIKKELFFDPKTQLGEHVKLLYDYQT